ncbi:HNH endonuclease signature motif containing protein [Micrococcoides hystricis]|uniref:HNH endonuclease signature motif containing protein n=1 Tax=Micrococcoides hystricis TaxID=1572761 RepID=A0ABV6PCP4_9MICC
MTTAQPHNGHHTHPHLDDQLRDSLTAVIAARGQQPQTPRWKNEHNELLRRYLAAAHFEESFFALLTFAQQDRPTLTAAELSAEFFVRIDEGKILRRASVEYAHAHRIEPQRARHLLLLAVNLHHFGQQILHQLRTGQISVTAAELAASKLNSIPEPSPKKQHNGEPWDPGAYEDARQKAQEAKRKLGEGLADLAEATTSEGDYKTKANQLRDEHHPEPAHIRHAKAVQKRYVRTRPAPDGMAHLEAYLPAADVILIVRTLKAIADRHRAEGLAKNRTGQQLFADVAVDLLLAARGLADAGSSDAASADRNGIAHPAGPEPPVSSASPHTAQAGSARHRQTIAPIQPKLFLSVTLAEWINLGGYLNTERMGYLKQHYPQLYSQAERNRIHYTTPVAQRTRNYPEGLLESGARAHAIGSGQQLDTAASAQLTAQAAMVSLLLTDPATGYPLGTGKRVHRASVQVTELVTVRDQTCRYPGCQQPALDCELDHVDEFSSGGRTGYENTIRLCRTHHGGKSADWWSVIPAPERGDGALCFTDPDTGNKHYSQPPLPLDEKAWRQYRTELDAANPPPF